MNNYETVLTELKNAKGALIKEGLDEFVPMLEDTISAMQGYGSLYLPHKKKIASIVRMLLEYGITNSEAGSYLNNAYECFEKNT